jgi:histidinol-phosphatase
MGWPLPAGDLEVDLALLQDLALLKDVAREAGQLALDMMREGAKAWEKSPGNPVTEADLAVNELIARRLRGARPEYGWLSEETKDNPADRAQERVWVVDPIDGTKAFVREYPMFSTQIALMHRGGLIVGVSSASEYGELAYAEKGEGAWLDGQRIRVSTIDSLEQATLSTGNIRALALGPRWAAFGAIVSKLDRIRGYGDFLHYHLLAAGKIEAVIETDVNILDIAALAAIIEAAGGRFTDLDGRPVSLATTSVLATNGRLHDPILRALGH